MPKKFYEGINKEDVEKELDRMVKEIEKDLKADPEALKNIEERDAKKRKEMDEIYGEKKDDEIEIDLDEAA